MMLLWCKPPDMRQFDEVVILQPDAERLRHFDKLVVLSNGRMVESGQPEEIMKSQERDGEFHAFSSKWHFHQETVSQWMKSHHRIRFFHAICLNNGCPYRCPSSVMTVSCQAYLNLLQSAPSTSGTFLDEGPAVVRSITPDRDEKHDNSSSLREEEAEVRPTVEMVSYYCRMGRWRNIVNCCLIFFIQVYIYLLCDLVLATWTNKMSVTPHMDDRPYLFGYLFWLILGTIFWIICWTFGEFFTLRISAQIHGEVLRTILRAPIDRFFDKHPVGRIMNRLSADLSVVDLNLFMKATSTIAILYQTLIPLMYIHSVLPLAITILAVPFYYLIWAFCVRYWNTTVPLRYCMSSARSDVNSLISDVMNNNVVIRAYRDQERISLEMCDAIDNQLKAGLLGDRVLRRWLVNRVVFMWSFYTTSMYMVGLLNLSCTASVFS